MSALVQKPYLKKDCLTPLKLVEVFRRKVSEWRRCIGKIETLIADGITSEIRVERDRLIAIIGDVTDAYIKYSDLLSGEDQEKEYHTFELIEQENQMMLRRIADALRDMESDRMSQS